MMMMTDHGEHAGWNPFYKVGAFLDVACLLLETQG